MSGLHLVSKRGRLGRRWHIYAWRGGPSIAVIDGEKPVITLELLDLAAAARREHARAAPQTVAWLCQAYRAAPEFTGLADSTQRDYRRWLDRIQDRFGTAALAAFEDRRMRAVIMAWRDGWAAQPRSADKASVMLATLLGWALQRGMLAINVAAGIPHLHRADRSEIIWTAADWQALAPHLSPQVMNALRLASLTGLRLGDLVAIDWANVGSKAITLTTAKRKRRAVIPILPELAKLLEGLLARNKGERKGAVLKNSRGKGWTASGLESLFQRARAAANGFDPELPKAEWPEPVCTVRIHDLRGTYVTGLAMRGLTDEEIGRIIGWKLGKIAEVRHRYVDENRVVISLVDRLTKAANGEAV